MDLVIFPSSLDRAGWYWPVYYLTHTKGRDRMQNKTNKDYCALCTLLPLEEKSESDSTGREQRTVKEGWVPCSSMFNPEGMGSTNQRVCRDQRSPSMSAREKLFEIVCRTWGSFQKISSQADLGTRLQSKQLLQGWKSLNLLWKNNSLSGHGGKCNYSTGKIEVGGSKVQGHLCYTRSCLKQTNKHTRSLRK